MTTSQHTVSLSKRILHDDGSGATENSLRYFNCVWGRLRSRAKPVRVSVDFGRGFSLEVYSIIDGQPCWVLLSGCTCGYSGTGPHGSLEILRTIFHETPQDVEDVILTRKHVGLTASSGTLRVLGDY